MPDQVASTIVARRILTGELPILGDSPLYLFSAILSARKSKDVALELITRRRLLELGVEITFNEVKVVPPTALKGTNRVR